ncbi:MAG: hypothetical protein KDN05_17195 [Verrucomicrobiae bacterium]|nr:hypothetical protein [Verrucomicrobiae bacterium]
MSKVSTIAALLLLTACKIPRETAGVRSGPVDARRFESVPGSMTRFEILISKQEGVTPDDKVFELKIGGDLDRYSGPAYLDDYAIVLYTFEGNSVALRSNGDNIYVREDMPIEKAYDQGWCVAELDDNDEYLHSESVRRFLTPIQAAEMNQRNKTE